MHYVRLHSHGRRYEDRFMRVQVNDSLCHGHQACAIAAPEIFGSDDYGNAVVLIEGDLPVALEAAAKRAAGNCPERAVIVIEETVGAE